MQAQALSEERDALVALRDGEAEQARIEAGHRIQRGNGLVSWRWREPRMHFDELDSRLTEAGLTRIAEIERLLGEEEGK